MSHAESRRVPPAATDVSLFVIHNSTDVTDVNVIELDIRNNLKAIVMADAAAKREARRRRILENSEYRLQRITGRVVDDDVRAPAENSEMLVPNASNFAANGILVDESFRSPIDGSFRSPIDTDIDVDESTQESPYSTAHDIFTLPSVLNVQRRRTTGRVDVSTENGSTGSGAINHRSSDDVGFVADSQRDNADGRDTSLDTNPRASFADAVLSTRLVYVILAIVVNIMVTLKLEHLFGTSIVVPFVTTTTGRLCICKNHDSKGGGGGLLIAALILSNVRPEFVKIIHRLKGPFSLSAKIFQDFAVYIFTFAIIHTVIRRFWIPLDALPFPNESEATIFDASI